MINRKQLHNALFLSNKQREIMYLDLQADFLRYNDINTRCAEHKDLVHESNPRPYRETIVRIRDIGSSLSSLRSKVATLRRTIFTARVRLHEASPSIKMYAKTANFFHTNHVQRKESSLILTLSICNSLVHSCSSIFKHTWMSIIQLSYNIVILVYN